MVIYTITEKIYLEKEDQILIDPTTSNKGVHFVVAQSYMELIVPFMPLEPKLVRVYSLTTGDLILPKQWTPEIREKAKELKKEAKGGWKLFMFIYIFAAFCLIAYAYTNISHYLSLSPEERVEENLKKDLQNPKKGDILYLKVEQKNEEYISPFKIVEVKEDSVLVVSSKLKAEISDDYSVDPSKVTTLFDNISNDDYNTDILALEKRGISNRHLLWKFGRVPKDKPMSYYVIYIKK